MKRIIIASFILILTTHTFAQTDTAEEAVFCTQDVKECPDGSYVARIALDCKFAPCPGEESKKDSLGVAGNIEDEQWVTEQIQQLLHKEGIDREIKNISMPLDILEKYVPLLTYEVCFDEDCLLVHYDQEEWFLNKDVEEE